MTKSLDWTRVSEDPNDSAAKRMVREGLRARRHIDMSMDLTDYIVRAIAGKSVLDIGVVAHAARYIDEPGWRHDRIRQAARHCLGIDILETLIQDLSRRGYNVRAVDATSETDLGERFEVVFIGDVIEHVENPVALLRFAGRHLTSDGKVLVSTPNPFSRKFFHRFRHDGLSVVNLDHVAWITPSMALELGRRANLTMQAYHLVKPIARWKRPLKRWRWYFMPPDYTFADFLFEFRRPAEVTTPR